MSVVISGITHLMFHGIGIADSTACGLIVGEEDSRSETFQLARVDWPGKARKP